MVVDAFGDEEGESWNAHFIRCFLHFPILVFIKFCIGHQLQESCWACEEAVQARAQRLSLCFWVLVFIGECSLQQTLSFESDSDSGLSGSIVVACSGEQESFCY